MELCQSHPIGIQYCHHRRIRHIDAYLNDRCRDQDLCLTGSKCIELGLLFIAIHPAMEQIDAETSQRPLQQLSINLFRADNLRFWIGLHARSDDVCLAATLYLLNDKLPPFALLRCTAQVGVYRSAPGRFVPQNGDVEVAKNRHGDRARDRSRRKHQIVRNDSRLSQVRSLLDPEFVLFIDDNQSERFKLNLLAQQGLSANYEIDRPDSNAL